MTASPQKTATASSAPRRQPSAEAYLRTDFLRALAHSLRSPLSVVHGAVGELARTADAPQLHAMARRNLQRITRLAEQLDWVAELEAGDVRPDREATDVAALVAEAASTTDWGSLAIERDLELAQGSTTVSADRRLLLRALASLLDNARRFAQEGVSLAVAREGGTVHVTVDDDGPGMADARLSAVFDRYRSARERGADSDLALGLSIARDYIELHGGSLDLSRSPTGGVRCHMTLPAMQASDAQR